MAISLFKVMDSHVSPLYRHYHIDYDDDIANLPGLDECCVGSTALSAESGTQYIIGSNGQWVVDRSAEHGGGGSGATVEPLSVTTNGTYTAPSGKAYSPVSVDVQPPAAVEPSDVNFIDYDGTIVYAYTAAEFAELAEMPANPTHDGWTSQGWNWTLADAKAYVASYGFLDIGQMYIPTDGKTHIHFTLDADHLKPYLMLGLDGTAVVDWGDGSAAETVTGSYISTFQNFPHLYAQAGAYEITVDLADGSSMAIVGGGNAADGSDLLGDDVETTAAANFYRKSITAIEIGKGVIYLRNNALAKCTGLKTVTLPSQIATISTGFCNECYNLRFICLPSSVTYAGSFKLCVSLERISYPKSITGDIPSYCFQDCRRLESVSIPPSVPGTASSPFYNCAGLRRVAIPEGFTNIGNSTFNGCASLQYLTLPASLQAINATAIMGCYDLQTITFKSATPPTVAASSAFSSLPTDCVIRVPSGSLSAYTSATNYPSSATYTYVEY